MKVGDKVAQGDLIISLDIAADAAIAETPAVKEPPSPAPVKLEVAIPEPSRPAPEPPKTIAPAHQPVPVGESIVLDAGTLSHASPSVRKFARELGVKLSGANLHRNWVTAPHVTQFDEADITDLEDFRKSMQADAEKRGVKLTMLAFLIKASVNALKTYPNFNSSLSADGDSLILKNYFNIGFACDTPDGLVVPVVKDVQQKDVLDIARDLADLSTKARERKLKVEEMQGGCFTISSLGGIGGTMFTPIINCPEVAILGVSRSSMQPVYDPKTKAFEARLMLPMSLSYDHRVVDGADGARFTSHMRMMLSDVRRLLL
jgi:pyruvate/2-oxoglutarate dehydrogenase complex dihydrolipoamide acyltransferase (E2) component